MTDDAPAPAMKMITMVLDQDGTALQLVQALRTEFDCNTANVHHARGTGTGAARTRALAGFVAEKDILTVVVSAERADEIFTALHERAQISAKYGGFMYQSALGRSHGYALPDVPDET